MVSSERWNIGIRECFEWATRSPKLEKVNAISLHKVTAALQSGQLLYPPKAPPEEATKYYSSILDHQYVPFALVHDWAAALEGSQDFDVPFDEWDFQSPYPDCDWEFRISGKPVLFLTRLSEPERFYRASAMIETSVGWVGLPLSEERNVAVARMMKRQVRAVCVSLDAEVATTELIRAPHKLNAARERRGVLPIPDYHVVKLNRRSRPEPLPLDGTEDEQKRRIRLHFRRGHWRHFEAHKTWIKWTLVGDPNLGFIDKHYTL